MHALLERPLLALAWLAAAMLLALGIRRIRASHRSGFFVTALSFFVALQGIAPAPAVGKDPRKTKAVSRVPLPPELREGERWAKFKDLWRRLDAVSPREREEALPGIIDSYSMTVDPEQQEAFRRDLAEVLGVVPGELYRLHLSGPPQKAGVDAPGDSLSAVVRALAALTLKRIEIMGMDRTVMMRMVPPPTLRFRGSVADRIELRIDVLMDLRARGVVSGEEFKTALTGLQDDVWVHALLAVFEDHRLGYFGPVAAPEAAAALPDPTNSPGDLWFDAAAWLRGFEQACKAAPEGDADEALREACRRTRVRLEELERVRGDLADIIRDLETP